MPKVGKLKELFMVRNYPRTFLVYLCVLSSKQKQLIEQDVARWNEIHGVQRSLFKSLNWYLTESKQFRNLLQHRLKNPSRSLLAWVHYGFARMLWRPLDSLYLNTPDIGGGLYIQHGFSTIVSASKIGKNCRIFQQVTIGCKGEDAPVLEDNVSVTCGAKVLGKVTMHRNSIAAAGAVVIKDVPENAIVGGVPAKVIGYKSEDNLDFQG